MQPHWTESDYQKILKRHGVGGAVDARHSPAQSGSRRDPATHNTTSRRGESALSSYRNTWEEKFATLLELEKRTGAIQGYAYETLTFTLSKGKRHRIDFLIWHIDGSIELAQIKGFHKNLRASMTALKWAAQRNPWFIWTIKRLEGTLWHSERVEI